MSYLNGPRINFWGGASINVDTANNEGQELFDLATASVVSSDSDDEIIEQLRTPSKARNGHRAYYTRSGWNYYGDHQVAFRNAKVSSSGAAGRVETTGELVDLPVYLLGSRVPGTQDGPYGGPVMVDLDPTTSQATMIYVGGFQIGNGEDPALVARADTRCHSHFLGLRYLRGSTYPPHLTPGSVFANGTFQIAFPTDTLEAHPDSEILQSILGVADAIGIVVRFSLFEFYPGLDTETLQRGYAQNRNPDNPSLGRVIGTVGPWLKGEPATCPPGRLLQNQGLGGAAGLAHVERLGGGKGRLTLDLVSALPGRAIRQDGQDFTGPIGPNIDYGDLSIFTATNEPIATAPSLPDAYYLFGGIHDIDLTEDGLTQLESAEIRIDSSRMRLSIEESRLRIYGDPRNIYLDEVGGETTLDLFLRELGGPVRQDTVLTLDTSVSGGLPDPQFLRYPPEALVAQGDDTVRIPVRERMDRMAGFLALDITAGDASYFVNFRKYRDDDYRHIIEKGDIPWSLVYEECLRYFYLIFPAMSRRIPLNDEATVTATAGEILKRISEAYRPTTLYMPLTRALSPGKLALLRAYLEQVTG